MCFLKVTLITDGDNVPRKIVSRVGITAVVERTSAVTFRKD